jgi:choloylglycine hydrolase
MWLKGTDYGARDASRPGLHAALWVQYILDNAATVDQALSIAGRIQPVPADLDGVNLPLAFGIEDRTGDSAIIEYLGGQPVIHHGREYRVMANTPMDQALAILGTFDFTGATRNVPLPGNTNSVDRFVRASFYSAFLSRTTPRNRLEAMAYGMSVARNVSDPIGAPGDAVGETHETDYRTVSDLTHGVYVFESTRGLATLRTDLRRIDFRRGSGARSINPNNPRLQGDVTSLYRTSRTPPPGTLR